LTTDFTDFTDYPDLCYRAYVATYRPGSATPHSPLDNDCGFPAQLDKWQTPFELRNSSAVTFRVVSCKIHSRGSSSDREGKLQLKD